MSWIIRTHLTFGIGIALFYVYFYFKFRNSIHRLFGRGNARKIKWLLIAGILLLNTFPLIVLSGWYYNPDLTNRAVAGYIKWFDNLVIVPYWLGFAFAGQMFLVLLLTDIARLLLYPVYRRFKPGWLRYQSIIILAVTTFMVVNIPVKTYLDTHTVKVKKTEFYIRDLPEKFDGFRIVHISDVQADPRTQTRKLERYVTTINKLDPHLVIHTGDLITSGTRFIEMASEALGKIRATYGVYACVGDHDYWSGSDSIYSALALNEVVYRDDASKILHASDETIGIALGTEIYRRQIPDEVLDSLTSSIAGTDLRILAVHQPTERLVAYARENGYHLLLGGHTHGGQVVFGLPPFLIQGSRLETRYVTGFFDYGSMLVSVNNGLGLTLAPIRYQAPSAVSLIVLRTGP
jgi:uncharacterized protein